MVLGDLICLIPFGGLGREHSRDSARPTAMAQTLAEGSYLLGLSRQEGKVLYSSYLGIMFPYFLNNQ